MIQIITTLFNVLVGLLSHFITLTLPKRDGSGSIYLKYFIAFTKYSSRNSCKRLVRIHTVTVVHSVEKSLQTNRQTDGRTHDQSDGKNWLDLSVHLKISTKFLFSIKITIRKFWIKIPYFGTFFSTYTSNLLTRIYLISQGDKVIFLSLLLCIYVFCLWHCFVQFHVKMRCMMMTSFWYLTSKKVSNFVTMKTYL